MTISNHRDAKTENKLFYRHFDIDDRAIDTEKRTISMSFSSETPVRRWYGQEILSHKAGHVQLGRATALLFGHNSERIVGPLSKVRIENNRGVAEARFDETEEGELAMKRVQSGSLRGVSVGYMVEKFRKLNPDEEFEIGGGKIKGSSDERNPTYVAVKWAPVEVSLTPIPADSTVGVGRDLRSLEGIEVEQQNEHIEDGGQRDMDQKEMQEKIDTAIASRDEAHRTALKQVFGRAAALGEKGHALAFRLLTEGKSPEQITDALFEEIGKSRGSSSNTHVDEERDDKAARFEQVSDDEFARSLADPATIILD